LGASRPTATPVHAAEDAVPVDEDGSRSTFRLLAVPGVTVDRWSRTWSERLPGVHLRVTPAEAAEVAGLLRADADAGLVRLPVDRETFDAIPLYTEVTVVVVPRDHLLSAADELSVADLAGETLLRPLDDVLGWSGAPATAATDRPASTAAAVELVAAGAGILVVPQSLARLHHRRDVTYRALTDAPTSSVALAWVRDRHDDLVEEMIGIVRGRTANSTRGRAAAPAGSGAARARPAAGRAGTGRAGTDPRTPPRRRGR
jgi:DNA-binding transcriptional LysR family regulator